VIAVVVPCYNARAWVGEAVRSALQPCEYPVEVLVIDDGSTDGSGALVREQFPDVRLVTTANRGVSHARNLGIELARGELLVFLDADDLLPPGRLQRQARLLEETGADVVYGNWQRLRPGADGEFQAAERVERSLGDEPVMELFTTFWCPTGGYTFGRAVVERVGGFSPRLPVIQDARFALDCALHGARFAHDAEVACLYRTHDRGSVSTRCGAAFLRDCLTSAVEVRRWWEAEGGLSERQRAALVGVFDYVARSSCGVDAACFAGACEQFEQVRAGGRVPGRAATRWLARLLGYRRAHQMATPLRRLVGRMKREAASGRQ
jgi:glycosyltransferase involved in cell wall biosynthesis